ncbi:MAG: histidine kinase [Bacteroidetes bacterium]|nr:histidine kinase [Bacteroidota bacterium]
MNALRASESDSAPKPGRWRRVGRHAVFWAVAAVAMLALYTRMLGSPTAAMWMIAATSPLFLGAVYFTLYVTLPHALYTRRYGLLLILVLYTLLGVVFLEILFFILLTVGVIPFPNIPDYLPPERAFDAVLLSAGPFIVTLAAVAVKQVLRARDSERTAQRLRQEKLEVELAMLRSQVHPHFLFNTLNNLYALTLKKSDQAPEAVLMLSQLLDYMLHESGAERVAVAREAALIEQYLALERLRYGPDVRMQFDQRIEAARSIAPLLFLPLVENSFKHGVSRCGSGAWVEISLHCDRRELLFRVANSLPSARADSRQSEEEEGHELMQKDKEGLGLKNVRSRLALLYPGAHRFKVEHGSDSFTAELSITFTGTTDSEGT